MMNAKTIRMTIDSATSAREVIDIVAEYSRNHRATDDVTCIVLRRDPV